MLKKKETMSRKKGKKGNRPRVDVEQPQMNYALDAVRIDDGYGQVFYPLGPNEEWDAMDIRMGWQRARELYENSPQIRAAVAQMVRFIGVLKPMPCTMDEEWNDLALAAWCSRTKNPQLFDLAGRVNYRQAMRFAERSAIIDGDVAIVPTFARDGGARFAFYRAPQIDGGGDRGVEVDKHGRAVRYYLTAEDGKVHSLPAWCVVLYQHDPDPTRWRGHTLLAPALRNAHDLKSIVGYTKAGVKIASSMGLVTTRQAGSKQPQLSMNVSGGRVNKQQGPDVPKSVLGTGLSITNLPEGMDIKQISDTRPSQQLQTFFDFLVRAIAQGVGLDPEMLFATNELSGSAARFSLEKLRRFIDVMTDDQEIVCQRMWQHVISCEIAAGRLRPCRDKAWNNVRWVPERDMTIDTARVLTAQLNGARECVADNDDFAVRLTGLTVRQLAKRRAADIAYMHKTAAEYGIDYSELCPGMVGSTAPAAPQAASVPPVEDDDPESPHRAAK